MQEYEISESLGFGDLKMLNLDFYLKQYTENSAAADF